MRVLTDHDKLITIKTYFKGVAIKAKVRQIDQWNRIVLSRS